jgi:hypothetical protein
MSTIIIKTLTDNYKKYNYKKLKCKRNTSVKHKHQPMAPIISSLSHHMSGT